MKRTTAKNRVKRRPRRTRGNWLTLRQLEREFGMSTDFWRRATKGLVDPLPATRFGICNLALAKIMVHRSDVDAWLRRRRDAKQVNLQTMVDDVARQVTGVAG
jgi:hypothetical protein